MQNKTNHKNCNIYIYEIYIKTRVFLGEEWGLWRAAAGVVASRTCWVSQVPVFHSFILPRCAHASENVTGSRSVCSSSLYRLEDITEQFIGNRNLTFRVNFPFDFLFIRSTGFPPNLGTILNFSEASWSQSTKLPLKGESIFVIVWFCLHWLTKTSRLMLPF